MSPTDPAGKDVRRTLTRAVALPLAFALLLGALLLVEVLSLLTLQRAIEQSHHVLEQARDLEKLLVDQETGVRGFLLAGREQFLEPYARAAGRVGPAMDGLERLLKEKPELAARVRRTREHHAQWQAFASEALAQRRAGRDVTPLVATGGGKQHMDAMRGELDALIAAEADARAARITRSRRAAFALLAGGAGLAVLLGFVLALVTRRQVRAVAETYNQSLAALERRTEELRQSEDRYRRLVELSPDGVIVHAQGTIRYANRAMASMLGMSDPSELVGRGVLEVIHPDHHAAVRARIRANVEEQRETPLFEQRFLRGDGSEVWVEVTGAPFRFDGQPGAQAIVRDISDRITARAAQNRLEAERAELLERLELVMDRMPAACVVNDAQFRFTYWNAAAERTFGYRFDEVKGKHPFDVITPPAVQPEVAEIFQKLERSPDPIAATTANVTRDGRTITCAWVNSAFRDRAGRFLGVVSMAQDITESLRAQEEVRRSAATLAQAQQIAHVGSWDLDAATGDVQWSAEMYRIFGQDPADFRTTRGSIEPLLHPDDRDAVVRALDAAYASDAPFDVDHRIVRPDGTVRHVNSQGQVVRDGAAGSPLRMIGTVHDITERKLAEEELRHLNETLEQRVSVRTAELREANEDLEAFGYTISHDLRSPMRAMRGFAQALLEDCAATLDETCTDYARRIVAAAARMDRLAQELLDYSQLSRRDLGASRVSVVLVLHDVLGQLQRNADFAGAQVEIIEPMPWVLAHRPTLAAVVTNLLENAAKFVAPGATPMIVVRAEDRPAGVTRVWFQDNGIGIAPEHHERVFNVFERLHGLEQYGGTGIGLAIVRRGVERMGGRVGVESTHGQGSRFWIELPKDPQSP